MASIGFRTVSPGRHLGGQGLGAGIGGLIQPAIGSGLRDQNPGVGPPDRESRFKAGSIEQEPQPRFVLRRIGKELQPAQRRIHAPGDFPNRTAVPPQLRERNAMQSFGRPIPTLLDRPIPGGLMRWLSETTTPVAASVKAQPTSIG